MHKSPPDRQALDALAELHDRVFDGPADRRQLERLERWFAGSVALDDRPTLADLEAAGYRVVER